MTDEETLEAIVATEVERLHRMEHLGDFGTAGPEPHPDIVDIVPPSHPCWENGWWVHATQRPAHPGRVGGPISPFAIVAHTCDMLREELPSLITNWTTKPGEGACAHFVIGRDAVYQMAPVNRNANHAGGPGHGTFEAPGRSWHPNTVTVGIEIHSAGGVRRVDGQWRLVEDGKAHGAAIPDVDVIPDPARTGRGWERVTDYQYERLAALLADLDAVLAPLPTDVATKAYGEVPSPASVMPTARIVTHAQLDPVHRADPWQPTFDWLRARAAVIR